MTSTPTAPDNAEQARAWNEEQATTWIRFEQQFHAAIAGYGEELVRAAGIAPGERVLDVGCGLGGVTLQAAQAASPGEVVGLDISEPMLRRAAEAAAGQQVKNVRFEVGDAQTYPFDGSFDIAMSRFGVMFFGSPVVAFRNIKRAVRAGGRLAVVIWQPLERNEWQLAVRSAVAQGRRLPVPELGAPGPFSLADQDHTRHILEEAGWREVRFEPATCPYFAGESAADAFTFISQQSATKGLLAELDQSSREKALSDLQACVEQHATAQGVVFGSSAWVVTARD